EPLAHRRIRPRRATRRAVWIPGAPAVMALCAPESSIAGSVFLTGRPQIAPVIVGPQLVLEDVLGVRGLPQHEIAGPLLPRGAEKEVDVGNVGTLQVLRDGRLGDPLRVQSACRGKA